MTNTDPSDEERFLAYGLGLVDAVDEGIRPWLHQVATELLGSAPSEVADTIEEVARDTKALLTELAHADVDQPMSGPLERIRRGVSGLTPVLETAGARRPHRDSFDIEMRPGDVFAIGPMAFSDLGEAVHIAGISWGAAKAHLHNQRRRGSVGAAGQDGIE